MTAQLLDHDRLERIAEASRDAYVSARPFPHACIDDFVTPDVVDRLLAEYPEPDSELEWRRIRSTTRDGRVAQDGKLGFSDETQLGPTLCRLFWELNSGRFLRVLEKLTGIEALIPDPQLVGGGLHQSLPGALLRVHADFTKHPETKLDRRLNLILFLNRDWDESYGGHTELWERDMSACVERVLPVAGRCLVFNTTADSFHGHPEPLTCPDGRTRKSLALYYYTNGRPRDEDVGRRRTNWRTTPDEEPEQGALGRLVARIRGR